MTVSYDARTDAELVGAYLAGDRNALGAIYDRFAPGLYDTARAMLSERDEAADVVQDVFCVAAAKLGQLREADRVKPWLYAIARHEVFRRTKRRGKFVLGLDGGGTGGATEPAAAPDPRAEGAGVESAELAALVREAARGLDHNDQLLLELSTRQGLVGAELAAAMGVTIAQSHSMLFRMRERVERAIGAYFVARGGRRDCPELAAVLTGWDGTFDVLWRKRIARHIDNCEQCTLRRRGAVAMVGLAPAFAAPAWLRDAALRRAAAGGTEPHGYQFSGDGGFPVPRSLRVPLGARMAAVTVAATIIALAIVLPLLAGRDSDVTASLASHPEAAAAAQPATTLPTTSTFTTTTTVAPSTTTPALVAPTTTVHVAPPPQPTTTTTTTTQPEPPHPTSVTTTPATTTPVLVGATAVVVATTAPTTAPNQPPRLSRLSVSPSSWSACNGQGRTTVSVLVADDAGIASVVATWSGQRQGGSATLAANGPSYSGVLGPVQPTAGTYNVVVTATDTHGATANATTTFVINRC